jgi:hypothetical protein
MTDTREPGSADREERLPRGPVHWGIEGRLADPELPEL